MYVSTIQATGMAYSSTGSVDAVIYLCVFHAPVILAEHVEYIRHGTKYSIKGHQRFWHSNGVLIGSSAAGSCERHAIPSADERPFNGLSFALGIACRSQDPAALDPIRTP